MKLRLLIIFSCSLVLSFNNVFGLAVPVISYPATVNNFPTSTAITSLTPTNTGGAATNWSISPTLSTGLAFSTSTGVISGTPTTATAATTYTITATNASGSGTTMVRIAVGAVNNWTGSAGGINATKWANTGNWSLGTAPVATDLVQIGVVAYSSNKQPAITAAAVTVNSITFGPNTGNTLPTLTLTGQTLTVSNALTVNEVGTSTNPTITGTGSVNLSPGATLNVGSGDILYTTLSGKLTLKSDATGSASVGQIASTSIAGSGADSIHVERFITGGTGHRGYYLMSSPVYAATVSTNNVYDLHYLIYGGMYLTGATGFDKAGNSSIYLYREDQVPVSSFTSGNFWGISKFNNTNSYDYNTIADGGASIFNIPAGNGYEVFFRGNRAGGTLAAETLSSFTTAPTVTLVASGWLNAGQIIVHDWFTPASANLSYTTATANTAVRGFNLVGNPYASSIDWETFNATTSTTGIYGVNISNTVYEYNILTHNYDTYQVGGSFTNNGSRTIVSGQGFFVLATAASPQLIFNESAKSTRQNLGSNLFMAAKDELSSVKNAAPDQHIRLQLYKDSINKDDTYIGFSSLANPKYLFNEDALYHTGTGQVSFASISGDHQQLAINKLPLPTTNTDTVFLNVKALASGPYSLNLTDVTSVADIYEIWLMDAYTRDSVNMRQTPAYPFNLNLSDTTTFGSHRFSLIIRQNFSKRMMLLNFSAVKASSSVQVNWETKNEENYTLFTVERSIDNGTTFNPIGGFISGSQGDYGFTDNNPVTGLNQYRLKVIDLNGTVTYSKVVSVDYSPPAPGIVVYPNPVSTVLNVTIVLPGNAASTAATDKVVTISSLLPALAKADQYSISIVNNLGAVVGKAESNQLTWQTDVTKLLPGSYVIQVVSKTGKGVIGQATFIKL